MLLSLAKEYAHASWTLTPASRIDLPGVRRAGWLDSSRTSATARTTAIPRRGVGGHRRPGRGDRQVHVCAEPAGSRRSRATNSVRSTSNADREEPQPAPGPRGCGMAELLRTPPHRLIWASRSRRGRERGNERGASGEATTQTVWATEAAQCAS